MQDKNWKGKHPLTKNTAALESMQAAMDALVKPDKRRRFTLDTLKRVENERTITKAT